MITIPTSDFELFKKQIQNPNIGFDNAKQVIDEEKVSHVKKNLVLSYVSDYTGCGHIRNIIPFTYMKSVFGRGGE